MMTPEQVRVFLLTLLSLFRAPEPQRGCLERSFEVTVQRALQAQESHGVPPGVLLFVGFAETHLGCDRNEGGNWGAPISRFRRHTAGTSQHAAIALRRSYEVCHTWEGAIGRFRSGVCNPPRLRGYGPRRAISWIRRLYQRADVPLPPNFERGTRNLLSR